MKSKNILTALLAFCFLPELNAKVELPSIISNNMVLQQQTKVKLWGKTDKKGTLVVSTSWNLKEYKTEISSKGTWEVLVETGKAGGPYNIKFNDGDLCEVKDVYLGEVWLCSGQSNMEMPIKGFMGQPVEKSAETIANASPSTPIRLFSISRNPSRQPLDDCPGKWETNTPESVSNFSATAYFFGLQLYKTLNIPIGLINSSWGGSAIQPWISSDALKSFPEISQKHLTSNIEVRNPASVASMLYNGMIYPIKNYDFKGVIWYQGESNRYDPNQYEALFKTLVEDWRKELHNADLSFYYVQIAPYRYENKDAVGSALLRQAQYNCEKTVPNVGMVVTMDIGNETCIHPAQKQEVGNRLAYMALDKTYGISGMPSMSPRYISHEVKNNKVIISFENAPLGVTSYYKPLLNFEIAGDDNIFYPAQAQIINRSQVEVWHDGIKSPKKVRYAFKNFVIGDLFGVNGMPVSSFAIDW